MAKLNLQEQIKSTRYGQSDGEDFEDIVSKASPQVSGRIFLLPLEQLVEYQDEAFEKITGRPQPFHPYSPEEMQALSKSIAEHGVIDPITVRPLGSETYQIIAGRNRTRASALCGKKEVPANITVYIPNNYTEAGKIFGIFEMRNVAEALILCVPLILLTMFVSPFGLTGTLITATVIVVAVGGFALIGIQDYSLLTFFRLHHRWRKNRRILIYRGSQWITNQKSDR